MPKSTLAELPACDNHTFEPDWTETHACFNCSMRAVSASERIHERNPSEFQICSRWPEGAVPVEVTHDVPFQYWPEEQDVLEVPLVELTQEDPFHIWPEGQDVVPE